MTSSKWLKRAPEVPLNLLWINESTVEVRGDWSHWKSLSCGLLSYRKAHEITESLSRRMCLGNLMTMWQSDFDIFCVRPSINPDESHFCLLIPIFIWSTWDETYYFCIIVLILYNESFKLLMRFWNIIMGEIIDVKCAMKKNNQRRV